MTDHSIEIAVNSEGESSNINTTEIAVNSKGESSNNSSSSSKPCIFKVPDILRRHSPKSFTPNSFSIGPIHYKKKYLKEQKKAEKIKQRYLNNLLTRKPTPQTTREDFRRSILEVEQKARQCYDVPFGHISKDEFVDMLVLDGCFIIEFLRNNETAMKKNDDIDKDDPVFRVSWVLQVLYHDLILLENQIPWFVLKLLFDMTRPPTTTPPTTTSPTTTSDKPRQLTGLLWFVLKLLFKTTTSPTTTSDKPRELTDLALHFIRPNFSKWQLPQIEDSRESNHILDVLRNALVFSINTVQESTSEYWQLIPTATSLRDSGIKFKNVESSRLLDITFVRHGVLKIPSLKIKATTCEMLRNLISYEQCYPNCEPKITSYAILLNNLINTAKDIEVLQKAGIVVNYLNPNDTLEFFNNIYTDTYVKTFYYDTICQGVKTYTDRLCVRARAAYVRNHFADPWAIVSQFVAGIVVILTIVQTVFTIIQSLRKQ